MRARLDELAVRQLVPDLAPVSDGLDQPGRPHRGQVLRHRWLRHREVLAQAPDAEGTHLTEQVDDLEAARIRECLEERRLQGLDVRGRAQHPGSELHARRVVHRRRELLELLWLEVVLEDRQIPRLLAEMDLED